MKEITSSASKIVFIAVAFASIGLTAANIMDVKDFFVLASGAFAYYFTKSNNGVS